MARKTLLKEKVYQYLYDKILTGELVPGDAIVEQDISKKLNVSRTPVREVIRQLNYEGLIKVIPQCGAFVAEISTKDVQEIYFLREILEAGALEIGMDNITMSDLKLMKKQLEALDDNSEDEEYFDADRKLHNMILLSADNSRLLQIYDNLTMQSERLRRVSAKTYLRLRDSRVEHLSIVNAMIEGDKRKAIERLRQHIQNVCKSAEHVKRNTGITKQI